MPRGVRVTDKQILAAIRSCKGLVYLTARTLGINPSTVHRRAQANPRIRELINSERQEFIDTAELALLTAVTRGEAWAVCFALKTQGRDRGYVERQEIKAEAKISVTISEEMTDEELCQIARGSSEWRVRPKIGSA